MARGSAYADNRNREVTTTMRHLKQRHLKRQLASNNYTVDPEQVAVAIIIKLAQGGPGAGPGDPSRGAGALPRFRQAA
jgi:hypothetical protein